MSATPRPRLAALDLLRGFTVAAMMVVNNPGNWNSVYRPLVHSYWDGVTFADLIFPAFIFIMGVSLSLARPDAAPRAGWSRYRRHVTRALVLVAMGLVLNAALAWPHVAALRVPGVLQRIGLSYLATVLVVLTTSARQQWAVIGGLLAAHWALLVWPNGATASAALAPDSNVAALVDRWLFGSHVLTPAGDPEGALGLLTSTATALCGASVGRWLVHDERTHALAGPWSPRVRLAAAGATAVLIGYAWSFALPLNKPLWTASFAVFTAGVSMLGLVAFLWLDATPLAPLLAPLAWLGTNPLAVYALSELTSNLVQRAWLVQSGHAVALKDLIYWSWLVPATGDLGGPGSSLLYAVGYAALWTAVAGLMRWRGVRLRA